MESTYHIVVPVFKSVPSDIVPVSLRVVDNNDLFLNELDELDIRISLTAADLSVDKLSDRDISDGIVVVVVVVSLRDITTRCPGQPSCGRWANSSNRDLILKS